MADSYKVGSPNNRNVGKHDSNTSNFIPVYGRSIMNDIMMNLLSMGFRHHLLHCRRLKVLQVLPLLRPCKPVRSECARSSRPTFRCGATYVAIKQRETMGK